MKTIGFALLLAVALHFPVMSQTISGYSDRATVVNSHGDVPFKTKWLEYPGTPVEGWQATLRLPTNTFHVQSNIEVEIVIKNVSTNDLSFSEAWPLLANGISVHILDKDKAEIPLTSFGKAQKSSGSASPNVSLRLSPGKEATVSLELCKLYQLESPGVYTVQATKSRPSSDKSRKLQVETGVAQIVIQPATNQKKD